MTALVALVAAPVNPHSAPQPAHPMRALETHRGVGIKRAQAVALVTTDARTWR